MERRLYGGAFCGVNSALRGREDGSQRQCIPGRGPFAGTQGGSTPAKEKLCALRAPQALTQSAQSLSATSVLKLFRPQRARRPMVVTASVFLIMGRSRFERLTVKTNRDLIAATFPPLNVVQMTLR
jgi:hypothetical protein